MKGELRHNMTGDFYETKDDYWDYGFKHLCLNKFDYTSNYGGRYWDVGFGVNAFVSTGTLQGNNLSFEWLQPVHTDVNGFQLPRSGALAATWSYVF